MAILRDGFFFHSEAPLAVPSDSQATSAGPSTQGADTSSAGAASTAGGASDQRTDGGSVDQDVQGVGNTTVSRGTFAMVGLDEPSHPDLAKIASQQFEVIRPWIRRCIHPKGRHVFHFRHELLLELATIGIHLFLTKYPHLREQFDDSKHLSRLIFASVIGIVSQFFIE